MDEVTPERTGWRDLELSLRHRKWGRDCPALDIDFLVIEYDTGRARGIVEYKHEKAETKSPIHPSYQAIVDLGKRADLPVFTVRYAGDFSWWWVTPLNAKAEALVPQARHLSEAEWVALLYRIRGRAMPESLLERMDIQL